MADSGAQMTLLSAPRLADLRLAPLLGATSDPRTRRVLARLLADPWDLQGTAEYYPHELAAGIDPPEIPGRLAGLRHAGWLHQRVDHTGLASRLRRDDLILRFPDVMRFLRVPAHVVGSDRRDVDWIASQLQDLRSGR